MDDTTITLVQDSFAKVAPISDAAAQLFYADLFDTAPHVQPLFKGDMGEQGKKLMATLGVVVSGLRNLDQVLPVAAELARRHVEYGVKPADYDAVGASLIHALEQGLGDEFTPEVRAAWLSAYGALAGAMIEAAYGTEAAQ